MTNRMISNEVAMAPSGSSGAAGAGSSAREHCAAPAQQETAISDLRAKSRKLTPHLDLRLPRVSSSA